MSDNDTGPVPNPAALTSVNGKGGKTDVWVLGDDIGAPGREYPDNPGVKSTLGAVKAGKNITIDPDGTINANGGGPTAVDWKDVTGKPATFPVAPATADAIGGVKPGKNLTVQADGTLDASGGSVVPATPTVLGGIKVGAGLNVTGDGTLSTAEALPEWSQIQNKPATFPVAIATAGQLGGVKEGRGINIEADGTINTASAAPEWAEILNKPAAFPPPVANTNTLGGVKQGADVSIAPDGTLTTNIKSFDWDKISDKPAAYPPTIASETEVGGVKAGNNISIEADGTINAAAVDLPIASTYLLGGVKIGAGITVAEDGTIGTEASAPYWLDIVDKPKAFPPINAKEGVVGGIMPDDQFTVTESGLLSAKPFKGKSFAVVQYDDAGNIVGSYTMQNKNGNLILGGTAPTGANGEEVAFGGQLTLLDPTGAYVGSIRNDSFDYSLVLTNGPNIKAGFLPFVTQVENADVSLAFGPAKDAIGYATKDKIGLAQAGGNLDVDKAGVISVKTASKGDRGVVKIGGGLDVTDEGLVTPSLATNATPGIVQIGSGLEVDQNGVLSATNAMAFVNRKVFTNNGFYGSNAEWTLPEGVDYFRVRVQGAGSNGGFANADASKGPGGGGGGGGAYMDTIFYGYKFEKDAVFSIVCGAPNGGAKGGTSSFFLKGGGVGIGAEGGTAGEDGSQPGPIGKGYSCGGSGGKPIQNGVDITRMLPPTLAFGADGMPGFTTKTYKGDKTVGGAGGGSFSSPSYHGGQGGPGFGSTGGGEANGSTGVAWGGGSYVIIEW